MKKTQSTQSNGPPQKTETEKLLKHLIPQRGVTALKKKKSNSKLKKLKENYGKSK